MIENQSNMYSKKKGYTLYITIKDVLLDTQKKVIMYNKHNI